MCITKHNLVRIAFPLKNQRIWGKYRHLLILRGLFVSTLVQLHILRL